MFVNDLRRNPLQAWPRLASVSGSTSISKGNGPTVFAHACKMGLEAERDGEFWQPSLAHYDPRPPSAGVVG
jgi:hypothetical protein